MTHRTMSLVFVAALFAWTGAATAAAPNFMPAIWGDGQLWGTKGTTSLPAPTENNLQSFDQLFIVANNPDVAQLPVSEAAPGNPHYNGGRWATRMVTWNDAAFAEFNPVPLLTSYEDIMYYKEAGYLEIFYGSAQYFQCPLLPVK